MTKGGLCMAEEVKPINATAENSGFFNRREDFSRRFNIDFDNNAQEFFKNSCLNIIERHIGHQKAIINKTFRNICEIFGMRYAEWGYETSQRYETFPSSPLYNVVARLDFKTKNDKSFFDLLLIVETIANESYLKDSKFASEIKKALKLSKANAVFRETPTGYAFYPAGAEPLDTKLVIDVLNWLSDYPKAKEKYNDALRLLLKGDRTRHVLDDSRLALELFIKEYLKNDKSLENQMSELGKFLKEKNLSKELRTMFNDLFKGYTTYNNNNVKHDDKIEESEIEFIIYITGAFMRLLITATKS